MPLTHHAVLERLVRDRTALIRRQAEADRVIAVVGRRTSRPRDERPSRRAGGRPWRIDPVPLVLDGATFDRLATGVAERVVALERILADLYGPRQLVARRRRARRGAQREPRATGSARSARPSPRRWLTTYAVDVVALADGTWRIVQDLTDAPTGLGYAMLDRSAMLRVADEILGPANSEHDDAGSVASLSGVAAELRHALAANTSVPSPRIVLYSGGVDHPGYVEHSSLARLLGYTLVERPDLVVRQGRVWLRALGGLDPIDVVYRRVEDDDTDPIEISNTGGPGVPGPAHGGRQRRRRARQRARLRRDRGPRAGARSGRTPRRRSTGSSLRLPQIGDAARTARLAEMPTFRDGELGSASVVVRIHAIAGPDGVTVVPGGNGRVLAPGDDPRHPSAHLAKDVWVIGSSRTLPLIVAPLPQVDLAQSVPTRAADALFWAGRAAERAEAIARTLRVVVGPPPSGPDARDVRGRPLGPAHDGRVARGPAAPTTSPATSRRFAASWSSSTGSSSPRAGHSSNGSGRSSPRRRRSGSSSRRTRRGS